MTKGQRASRKAFLLTAGWRPSGCEGEAFLAGEESGPHPRFMRGREGRLGCTVGTRPIAGCVFDVSRYFREGELGSGELSARKESSWE